ncbi:unnamed protein product [Protopolystoma xenopodis]|uniref:Uncharacterized protein n=1 Tax=Protopolystoma xenopodis TaxID=117903 RepID=A0A3S5CRB4_9PLAT|nr:unnamed protein product [Protopolystoma xenopodis]
MSDTESLFLKVFMRGLKSSSPLNRASLPADTKNPKLIALLTLRHLLAYPRRFCEESGTLAMLTISIFFWIHGGLSALVQLLYSDYLKIFTNAVGALRNLTCGDNQRIKHDKDVLRYVVDMTHRRDEEDAGEDDGGGANEQTRLYQRLSPLGLGELGIGIFYWRSIVAVVAKCDAEVGWAQSWG